MSWLSNLLGGGPGAEPPPEPEEQDRRERVLQLCVGARRAARALPDPLRDLRRETGEATRSLEERVEAALPEESTAGRPGSSEADGLLEEAVDALERLHFGLLRVEVYGEDPEEPDLSGALEEVRGVASRLQEMPARSDAASGGGEEPGGSRTG